MEPTKELIAQLHREDIQQAKQMTPEQRLLAGGELFDDACAITMAGIRQQNPSMSEREVVEELRRRLRIEDDRKNRLCYGSSPEIFDTNRSGSVSQPTSR